MLTNALTRRGATSPFFTHRDPFFRVVDSMFRDWPTASPDQPETTGAWVPAVDIREDDDAFHVVAELPGLSKKEVEVSIEDNVLSLRGERTFENKDSQNSYRRIERAYGTFQRSFSLPTGVDSGKAKATFKDGLLTLTVPKAETAKARTITIA